MLMAVRSEVAPADTPPNFEPGPSAGWSPPQIVTLGHNKPPRGKRHHTPIEAGDRNVPKASANEIHFIGSGGGEEPTNPRIGLRGSIEAIGAPRTPSDPFLEARLASLSSNSELIVAENSGHAIMWDEPDLVIEAVRMVISTARPQ